jgi:hypothetical protein
MRIPRRSWHLALTGVATCGILVAAYWLFNRGRGPTIEEPPSVAPPTCHIRFLTREERLNPEPRWRHILYYHEVDRPYPVEQVDNPVLFQNRYARVRFENTTGRVLAAFAHARPSVEEDARVRLERQRAQIHNLRGLSDKERAYLLQLLEIDQDVPTTTFPCAIDVAVYGADGKEIEVIELYQSMFFGGRVPTAAEIHANAYPTVSLQPGDSIEFPISILGKLTSRERGLKPGAYTVRATVSYAEAPNGETKRVTSEPLTVAVTEDHIKAAEAYWAAAKK